MHAMTLNIELKKAYSMGVPFVDGSANFKKELKVTLTEKIEIGHIDFLRDVAYIKLYYVLGKGEHNSIDEVTKPNQYIG